MPYNRSNSPPNVWRQEIEAKRQISMQDESPHSFGIHPHESRVVLNPSKSKTSYGKTTGPKILDMVHPTTYFPKTSPALKGVLDFKSPERIPEEVGRPSSPEIYSFMDAPPIESSLYSRYLVENPTTFQKDMLDIHNKLRHLHDTPHLKLHQKMCDYAQKCTDYMAGLNSMKLTLGLHGENMYTFVKLKGRSEAAEACEHWYKEKRKYKYDEPKISHKNQRFCHFTQMIWAETKFLGVGIAQGRDKTYIVAHYLPKGNEQGKYRSNVLKPKRKHAGQRTFAF